MAKNNQGTSMAMLTPKKVAKELSLSAAKVSTWVKAGKLKALVIPGKRTTCRFSPDYIAGLKNQGNNQRQRATEDDEIDPNWAAWMR